MPRNINFDLDTLVHRDTLGRIRMAIDGFDAYDLRVAHGLIGQLRSYSEKTVDSFANTEDLRRFLLADAEQMDLKTLVIVADRLKDVGFHQLGKVDF